ncbi:hypothetical protein [Dehalococcoides mccartyi]|uniref:hypothetical protein n=1 Tax=Dehalococcoides mccartyi TaxID=61435 RepID=UPI000870F8FB|nr:hypothetical protein [Dehalococcoides mccartyi]AOV98747.1 hypothetical protein DCWBC2_0070 [Dehalococcoides mccartyi]
MTISKNDIKEYSATSLAKELNITPQDAFNNLHTLGFIVRKDSTWELTPLGVSKGGTYKHNEKFGRYISWPESVKDYLLEDRLGQSNSDITSTVIGKHFGIPVTRINSILSELGWIKKHPVMGWELTAQGKLFGGVQYKFNTTGAPFVKWPKAILSNKILITNVNETQGEVNKISSDTNHNINEIGFRDKFKAEFRVKDGHYVRSKSETIIDNWLYDSKIIHAYERKLAIEEDLYCDFYIPTEKVYIEFWGSEEESYLARKKKKLEIYKKYNFRLIELTEKDIANIDDILPAKLLDYGIAVE